MTSNWRGHAGLPTAIASLGPAVNADNVQSIGDLAAILANPSAPLRIDLSGRTLSDVKPTLSRRPFASNRNTTATSSSLLPRRRRAAAAAEARPTSRRRTTSPSPKLHSHAPSNGSDPSHLRPQRPAATGSMDSIIQSQRHALIGTQTSSSSSSSLGFEPRAANLQTTRRQPSAHAPPPIQSSSDEEVPDDNQGYGRWHDPDADSDDHPDDQEGPAPEHPMQMALQMFPAMLLPQPRAGALRAPLPWGEFVAQVAADGGVQEEAGEMGEGETVQRRAAQAVLARQPQAPVMVDVVRPGTVLMNCTLHLPEHYMLRVLTSCTLHNVTITGAGFLLQERWKFTHYGLVEVGWPGCGPMCVELSNVKIAKVIHSNGIRFLGAVHATLKSCVVEQCSRNGIIVLGPGTAVALHNCTLSGNDASGMWMLAGGAVSMTRCRVFDNGCNGVAVWDPASRLAARSCSFRGNELNGLRLLYASVASLLRCDVVSNGGHGLEVGNQAVLDATHCVLHGNREHGVDAYIAGRVMLQHCVLNRSMASAKTVNAKGRGTLIHLTACELTGEVRWVNGAEVVAAEGPLENSVHSPPPNVGGAWGAVE